MLELPAYIPVVFIATTLCTLVLFYKATKYSKIGLLLLIGWLGFQGILAYQGFYMDTEAIPPRVLLAFLPTLVLIIGMFAFPVGQVWLKQLDLKTLTLLHTVRVPVEFVLYWLYLYKGVPELMTFAGRNFDILAGITAPIIYYFAFVRKTLSKKMLLLWNVICLGLLLNIVINALLSAPIPIQVFAFDQPNIAVFYFPYIWLPSVVVPIVLFAHLVAINRLLKIDIMDLQEVKPQLG
ncbi:MAG: hypothetical protein DHS20C18_25390 [Saprospiraceae bacterium]|nr:MAG: hypothetical protein DHS20C18_25390 [Saprospiraceae bacterium]